VEVGGGATFRGPKKKKGIRERAVLKAHLTSTIKRSSTMLGVWGWKGSSFFRPFIAIGGAQI